MRCDDVRSNVAGHSPVVNYQQGIDIVASRIFHYEGKAPYIVTLHGIQDQEKIRFARDVQGRVSFNKRGETLKLHDLRREQYAYRLPDYFLVEVTEEYLPIIDMETQKLFHKVPDINVLMISDISQIIDSEKITLKKLLQVFNLVVENIR